MGWESGRQLPIQRRWAEARAHWDELEADAERYRRHALKLMLGGVQLGVPEAELRPFRLRLERHRAAWLKPMRRRVFRWARLGEGGFPLWWPRQVIQDLDDLRDEVIRRAGVGTLFQEITNPNELHSALVRFARERAASKEGNGP